MNELSRHLAARPLTGRAFIDSLQDGREVFFDGERIDVIATHPAFRNSARSLARLYDALHDPAQQPGLTCATDTGNGHMVRCCRWQQISQPAVEAR